MLSPDSSRKVTNHLNGDASASHTFRYQRDAPGASLVFPHAGLGFRHRPSQSEAEGGGEHMPARVEFGEAKEIVDSPLRALNEAQDGKILELAAGAKPV